MPLKKGYGKKSIAAKRGLLFFSTLGVDHVLHVSYGVAVRAKDNKIVNYIIKPISVNMVNPKDSRILVKSTIRTFTNIASFRHRLSDSCERWVPYFQTCLAYALSRTIDAVGRLATFELLPAVATGEYSIAFIFQRYIVALPRTIFGLIAPTRNMAECVPTYFAHRRGLDKRSKRKTFTTTILGGVGAVKANIKRASALFTHYTDHGGSYAAC